jgi:hypothetical protein
VATVIVALSVADPGALTIGLLRFLLLILVHLLLAFCCCWCYCCLPCDKSSNRFSVLIGSII